MTTRTRLGMDLQISMRAWPLNGSLLMPVHVGHRRCRHPYNRLGHRQVGIQSLSAFITPSLLRHLTPKHGSGIPQISLFLLHLITNRSRTKRVCTEVRDYTPAALYIKTTSSAFEDIHCYHLTLTVQGILSVTSIVLASN